MPVRRILNRLFPRPPAPPRQFLIAPSQVRLLEAGFDPGGIGANRADGTGQSANTGKRGVGPATVVSFATRDGTYDTYLHRLAEACASVGMRSSVETIPACPPENAFLFKPTFIKTKLLTRAGPIIWLDADALITERLVLPDGAWDVGTLPNNLPDPVNPVAALCIAFNPTVGALRFLEHWEQLCSAHWLKPGHDHRRLNYTREILAGHFVEADLSDAMRGRLVRDAGRGKEAAF
jgi:hypothetical protein